MRNARILGLMLVAMLGMSAVIGVSAQADQFTAEKYPVTLTGESDPGFTDQVVTTAGAVKCPKPTYVGTLSGPGRTISITPDAHDEPCTAFGFPATIAVNGCQYVFHVNTVGTEGGMDIECPDGKEVTIIATSAGITKCTAHLPTQTSIPGTVKYSNAGLLATVQINLSGLKYTHTAGMGLGACASGSASNGTLEARSVMRGEEESAPHNKINVFLS